MPMKNYKNSIKSPLFRSSYNFLKDSQKMCLRFLRFEERKIVKISQILSFKPVIFKKLRERENKSLSFSLDWGPKRKKWITDFRTLKKTNGICKTDQLENSAFFTVFCHQYQHKERSRKQVLLVKILVFTEKGVFAEKNLLLS